MAEPQINLDDLPDKVDLSGLPDQEIKSAPQQLPFTNPFAARAYSMVEQLKSLPSQMYEGIKSKLLDPNLASQVISGSVLPEYKVPEQPSIPQAILKTGYEGLIRPLGSLSGIMGMALAPEIPSESTMKVGPIPESFPARMTGKLEPVVEQSKQPTFAQIPEPKVGLPPYNTSQFGLSLSKEALPYPQNVVPNRVRAPSTNAIVFDSLVPERYKYHEQGAATPLTTSVEKPSQITTKFIAPADTPIIGDKPPRDLSTPVPTTAIETVLPPPGQSGPSAFEAGALDPSQVLAKHSPKLVDVMLSMEDNRKQFITNQERAASDVLKVNDADAIRMGKARAGLDDLSDRPDLAARNEQFTQIMEAIHKQLPEETGHWEDYFTHIEQKPNWLKQTFQDLFDWHGLTAPFKSAEVGEPTGTLGDLFEKGFGEPGSPYVKPRTGKLENIEYNLKKVAPVYIESISREIFDKPAIAQAEKLIKDLPSGTLKEMASAWVRNASGYKSAPELANKWGRFMSAEAGIAYRHFLPFNVKLHIYHLGQVPTTIFPELNTRYTLEGIRSLSFLHTWDQMGRLGMLQSEIRPWNFRTPVEKFQSVGNFMGYVESFIKGTAYNGMRKKLIDSGMEVNQAEINALRFAKTASLTMDRVRAPLMFKPPQNFGEVLTRNLLLFKGQPLKLVENTVRNFFDVAQQIKENPKAFDAYMKGARLLAGVGTAGVATEKLGIPLYHAGSAFVINSIGPVYNTVFNAMKKLSNGDIEGALVEIASFLTPVKGAIPH